MRGSCQSALQFPRIANATVTTVYHGKLAPQLVYDYGPVVVDMHVYENFMKFKGGDIYKEPSGKLLFTHSVLIIGTGTGWKGEEFYIAKNSWGKTRKLGRFL